MSKLNICQKYCVDSQLFSRVTYYRERIARDAPRPRFKGPYPRFEGVPRDINSPATSAVETFVFSNIRLKQAKTAASRFVAVRAPARPCIRVMPLPVLNEVDQLRP